MKYQTITNKLIESVEKAKLILLHIENSRYKLGPEAMSAHTGVNSRIDIWGAEITEYLKENGLILEGLRIENILNRERSIEIPGAGLGRETEALKKAVEVVLDICEKLESSNKKITQIFVDDIDCLKSIISRIDFKSIDPKYCNSAFLEDDVENEFLKILGEPFKEYDSGAETRDLYTDKITINGKRHSSVFMFKGRGIKDSLKISNSGLNGDQLLKLSKNSFVQLYVIQHVNKVEPEVVEALRDHISAHSTVQDVKICVIDGTETARILKGNGLNLDELIAKKSKAGRKPKSK